MYRKSSCERIVLTKSEKRLLRYISNHPHTKCEPKTIRPLYEMGLVRPDTEGKDAFNAPIPKDTYCVSELYLIYQAYQTEQRFWLLLKSLWLPIVGSVITTLVVNGLQWLLPMITGSLTSFL